MIKKTLLTFISVCLMLVSACNRDNRQTADEEAMKEQNEEKFEESDIKDDIEFIMEAANEGLMELQLGQLAQQKGFSPKVKEFGTTIITDQTRSNDELKDLATKKGITVPQHLNVKDQEIIKDLLKKEGSDFDKAYMKLVLKDHEKDIERFQKEAEKGKDPEIKAFATGKLPILLQHLQFATSINNSIQENQL